MDKQHIVASVHQSWLDMFARILVFTEIQNVYLVVNALYYILFG